jgi:hypothetical protein
MNGHLWREFFLTAFNPVFKDGQPYVDLCLFSQERYPALKILKKHLSTLEILILAELILISENDDPEDQFYSEVDMEETFENYDCTKKEILLAVQKLQEKGWAEIFVDLDDAYCYYKACIPQLIIDRIYTENEWSPLFKLGLYGSKLCKN